MHLTKSNGTYLSVEDVAKKFSVNPTTIYRLAQKRKIPGFKIGSQWRFSEEMLEVWVRGRADSNQLTKDAQ